MKTKQLLLTALATLLPLSLPTTIQAQHNMNKKEQVVALLKSLETRDTAPLAVISPKQYTQHNLAFPDGLSGLQEALASVPAGAIRVDTKRVFQDGDFVFAHTAYDLFGPKIGFDVYRFADGQIIEHWDNLQETPTSPNPSGHSMIDGATEVKDLEKTAENKELVRSFVRDVLMGQAPERIASYFDGDHYIQHNPAIADGLSGLGQALQTMAEQGVTMTYTRNHIVLGEGNFVLSVSEGEFAGKAVAFYDLFRIEGGKIAEHWDTIEPILPEEAHQNKNGKFGF